jgi:Spx/MgsR family transcriptional regulator
MYGISNCDTIKKAKKWLEAKEIEFSFHDYRKDGLDTQWLAEVAQAVGWEQLVNKRGTTYRKLTDEQKAGLNQDTAIALLAQYPAMIKRPLLCHNNSYLLGFKASDYEDLFTL